MIVGPISKEELPWDNFSTIPLHSVAKVEVAGTRRICAYATHSSKGLPVGIGSLNQGIKKGEYGGFPFQYNLPTFKDLVNDAVKIGLDKVQGFKGS